MAGAKSSRALDEDGEADEEAEATCPACKKNITAVVGSRLGRVQLRAARFECGGWKRATGKKGSPDYSKSELPGTWTLYPSEAEPGKFYTSGPHLQRLGGCPLASRFTSSSTRAR